MRLLKQRKRNKKEEKKQERNYYEFPLSEKQRQLTGMDKFKEALKICEKEMHEKEEEERNRLGEKAYQKKKKRELKKNVTRRKMA